MKKKIIYPTKTRVKGNVLTKWDENTKFETFHLSVQKETEAKRHGIQRNMYNLVPTGEPIYMNLDTAGADINKLQVNTDVLQVIATIYDTEDTSETSEYYSDECTLTNWTNTSTGNTGTSVTLNNKEGVEVPSTGSGVRNYCYHIKGVPVTGEYDVQYDIYTSPSEGYLSTGLVSKNYLTNTDKGTQIYYYNEGTTYSENNASIHYSNNGTDTLLQTTDFLARNQWTTILFHVEDGTVQYIEYTNTNGEKKQYTINQTLTEEFYVYAQRWNNSNCAIRNFKITLYPNITYIKNQQVYVAIDDELVDQQLTDTNGQITYNYHPTTTGEHKITCYTKLENGYSPIQKTITVHVPKQPLLTLLQKENTTGHYEPVTFTAELVDGKTYFNNVRIALYIDGEAGNDGIIMGTPLEITYTETAADTALESVSINLDKFNLIENHNTTITGQILITSSQTPVPDILVYYYKDYSGTIKDTCRTDTDGKFNFMINITDRVQHVLVFATRKNTKTIDSTEHNIAPKYNRQVVVAKPSPAVNMEVSTRSLYYNEKNHITVTLTEGSHIFSIVPILIEYRKIADDGTIGDWKTYKTLNTDKTGLLSFYYPHTIFTKQDIRATYQGDEEYAENTSETIRLTTGYESVAVVTNISPQSLSLNQLCDIETRVTDRTASPVEGLTVTIYEDKEDTSHQIYTGTTNEKGAINISNAQIAKTSGTHKLITRTKKSIINNRAFNTKTYTIQLEVTKSTYQLQVLTDINSNLDKSTITTSTNHEIEFTLQLDDTCLISENKASAIKNTAIQVTIDGTEIERVKTDSNGTATFTYAGFTTEGVYNIAFNILSSITGSTNYEDYTTTRNIIVEDRNIAELTVYDKTVIKGQTSTIIGQAPTDATDGTFLFAVHPDTGNEWIIGGTRLGSALTNQNGTISIDYNFSDRAKGRYTYYLRYNGGTDYLLSKSERKDLIILGSFEITCDQIVGDVISDTAGTMIQLTGEVIDRYGDGYTGNLYVTVEDTKVATIPVTAGTWNKDKAIIDTTQYGLTAGSYELKFTTDSQEGVKGELTTQLHLQNNTDVSISQGCTYKMLSDTSRDFWVKIPSDANGKLTLYQTDKVGNIKAQLKGIDTVKDTSLKGTTENGLTTWNTHDTKIFKSSPAGVYYYVWKLTGDSTYTDTTTAVNRFKIFQQAVISTNELRVPENSSATLQIKVTNPYGNPASGLIVLNDGTNGDKEISIVNGEGAYVIPKNARAYSNTNHITNISLKYNISSAYNSEFYSDMNGIIPSTLRSQMTNTTTKTVYNLPKRITGIVVNNNGYLLGDNAQEYLAQYYNQGLTTLFVRVNTESNSFSTLDKVLTLLNTPLALTDTTITPNEVFNVYVLFNCMFNANVTDGTGWSYYWNTTGKHEPKDKAGRIAEINTFTKKVIDTYGDKIDGFMFDYLRCSNKEYGEYNSTHITDILKQISDNIKSLTTDRTCVITSTVTGNYADALTTNGQNYYQFGLNCDFVCPMLYVWDYNDTFNLSWMQLQLKKIRADLNNNGKIAGMIQNYKGSNNTNTPKQVREFRFQYIDMWLYGSIGGAIIFRDGMSAMNTTATAPPVFEDVVDTSTSSNNRNVFKIRINTTPTDNIYPVSKATVKTTGLGLIITDYYDGYINGIMDDTTTCTVTIEGISNSAKILNGTTYVKMDLSTLSDGEHTATVKINGNNKAKVSTATETLKIKLAK